MWRLRDIARHREEMEEIVGLNLSSTSYPTVASRSYSCKVKDWLMKRPLEKMKEKTAVSSQSDGCARLTESTAGPKKEKEKIWPAVDS